VCVGGSGGMVCRGCTLKEGQVLASPQEGSSWWAGKVVVYARQVRQAQKVEGIVAAVGAVEPGRQHDSTAGRSPREAAALA